MSISTAAMFALEFWKRGYPPPEKPATKFVKRN